MGGGSAGPDRGGGGGATTPRQLAWVLWGGGWVGRGVWGDDMLEPMEVGEGEVGVPHA